MSNISISNLKGKTIVITGATSGIGLSTAMLLAEAGASVIATGRSEERCRKAQETIISSFNGKSLPALQPDITYLCSDLSSLRQTRELARKIKNILTEQGKGHIDVLINNAGTVSSWYTSTEEGFELQFAVNYLSPFLLTYELLPLLKSAPAGGRIIALSSGSHFRTRINWKDIQLRRHYNCLSAYKQTKLALVMLCTEFNRRHASRTGITAFAADPGLVNTDIGFKGTTGLASWIWKKRSKKGITPESAAAAIAFLAEDSSIQKSNNVYWKECRPVKPSSYSQQPGYTRQLWELSKKMCGIIDTEY